MIRLMRKTHKWGGILFAIVLVNLSVTGILLLVKKDFAWIQPPTSTGAEGDPARFITPAALFAIVLAQGHPAFRVLDDIDRVDFRPGKRVYKVQSVR